MSLLNNAQEGELVLIKGIVNYSRLSKQISGEELAKDIARNQARGSKFPISVPYTTATIGNAEVLYGNPAAPSAAEQYVASTLYQSASNGVSYTGVNKGKFVPKVYALKGPEYHEVELTKELAGNQPVILVMRVFASKNFANKSLTLDKVLLQTSAPVYFEGRNQTLDVLAQRGFVLKNISEEIIDDTESGEAPVAMPAPGAPVMQAPTFNPAPMGGSENFNFAGQGQGVRY